MSAKLGQGTAKPRRFRPPEPKECREGVLVEALACPLGQASVGRASNGDGFGVSCGTPGSSAWWRRGGRRRSRGGAPRAGRAGWNRCIKCTFPLFLSFVNFHLSSLSSTVLGGMKKGSPTRMAMPVGDGATVMYKNNTAAAMARRAECGRINN